MTLGDTEPEPLVHIQDFRMDFRDTMVIKDLSFDVRAGETFLPGSWAPTGPEDHHTAGAAGIIYLSPPAPFISVV